MTDINDSNDSSFPRSRVKKQSNKVLYLFILIILLLTAGFYFYQKGIIADQQGFSGEENSPNSQDIDKPGTDIALPSSTETTASSPQQNQAVAQNSNEGSKSDHQLGISSLAEDSGNLSSTNSRPPANDDTKTIDAAQPGSTEVAGFGKTAINYNDQLKNLNLFYAHLDSQPYMQAFGLPEPSKIHFSKLIQKLIDNPPVVTRETDDLFTLLKNTAHFFRIIGKDNILVLKGILDREKDSFESILQSLYLLTERPELLEKEYNLKLDYNSLYDYAGFFLNTMGGRLYLFRRDSNSRMAVSFYAIKLIDQANDSGDSHNGVDIRPAIDSLIEEIENGGNNLKKRELYLDTLYDLKVKYN